MRAIRMVPLVAAVGHPAMEDETRLRPVTTDELVETIAFALHYDGRGRLAAERAAAHLEQSRFVVMKKPPLHALQGTKRPNLKLV